MNGGASGGANRVGRDHRQLVKRRWDDSTQQRGRQQVVAQDRAPWVDVEPNVKCRSASSEYSPQLQTHACARRHMDMNHWAFLLVCM